MKNSSECTMLNRITDFLWPVERHENKKFIPMALMMAFILANYAILRSIKDGFVVTEVGPEAISFLKTYFVLPSAMALMILYAKLCNIMTARKIAAQTYLDKMIEELEFADNKNIAIVREKLHHYRWMASKLIGIYGDKQEIKQDTNIQITWSNSDQEKIKDVTNSVNQ